MRKARRCLKWPARPFTVKVYANLPTLNHVTYRRVNYAQNGRRITVTVLGIFTLNSGPNNVKTNQFVLCAKCFALIPVGTLTNYRVFRLSVPGHVTVVDKFQLHFTVLPAAILNCHGHLRCICNFSFPIYLSVIYRPFEVKDAILRVT